MIHEISFPRHFFLSLVSSFVSMIPMHSFSLLPSHLGPSRSFAYGVGRW